LVLTTGANIGAVAVHAAFLLRIKTVYLELTGRVSSLSLSSKLVYPFASHLLVQWEELANQYGRTEYQGRVI
jgi:UDP-N-acetylglucosamine:LPS N-acetylglucosamine transferase